MILGNRITGTNLLRFYKNGIIFIALSRLLCQVCRINVSNIMKSLVKYILNAVMRCSHKVLWLHP